MKQSPTLKDVAKAAGVATTTVARVINKKGYVAEDTRQKVIKALQKTGYRVNSLARSLKSNRSYVIGHLLRSTEPNPFFVKIARGVEEYARGRGYTILTYNMHGEAEAEKRGIDTFLNWRADALIFSTPVSSKNIEYAIRDGIPVVQVERPRSELGHRITVQNYQGCERAMQHLLDLGHKQIAYIGVKPDSQGNLHADYVENERFGAYQDILKKKGWYHNELVKFAQPRSGDHIPNVGHGYRSMEQIINGLCPATAVLASNDMIAAGILQAIQKKGLSVPDDISVIGFDDTFSQYLSPLLTTVRLPAQLLGQTAAKLAIDHLETKEPQKNIIVEVGTELIVRDSTGPRK